MTVTVPSSAIAVFIAILFLLPVLTFIGICFAIWIHAKSQREYGNGLALILQARMLVANNELDLADRIDTTPSARRAAKTIEDTVRVTREPESYTDGDLVDAVYAGRTRGRAHTADVDLEDLGAPPPASTHPYQPVTVEDNERIPEQEPIPNGGAGPYRHGDQN